MIKLNWQTIASVGGLSFLGLLAVLMIIPLSLSATSATSVSIKRDKVGETTDLPIPRYVSIAAGEANMRTGPGTRHPIAWVYEARNLPVKVIGEFDHWRRVEDVDGTRGWMHKTLLSGRRFAIVRGGIIKMYDTPNPGAPVVAKLEGGVLVRLLSCNASWCRVLIDQHTGHIRRTSLWGLLAEETFD